MIQCIFSTYRYPCGETENDQFYACGCGGDDSRCNYYLDVYSLSSEQVCEEHICCKIPNR